MTWYNAHPQQEQMMQDQQEQVKRNGSLTSYGPQLVGGPYLSKEMLAALKSYESAFEAYKDAHMNYTNAHKELSALWDEHATLCQKLQESFDEVAFKRWQEVTKVLYSPRDRTDATFTAMSNAREAFHKARNECHRLFSVEHLNHAEVQAFLDKT